MTMTLPSSAVGLLRAVPSRNWEEWQQQW
jgi:hypothetical protein